MLPTLPPHDPRPDQPGRPEFLSVRASRYLLGMVFAVGMFWVGGPVKDVLGPVPVGPQLPVQEWRTAVPVLPVLASALHGGLPAPDPRQRKPPCQVHMGEEALNGVCWLRLDIEPPCPTGQAWERNGKCYSYALRAAAPPQSGEVRAGNVAGEP